METPVLYHIWLFYRTLHQERIRQETENPHEPYKVCYVVQRFISWLSILHSFTYHYIHRQENKYYKMRFTFVFVLAVFILLALTGQTESKNIFQNAVSNLQITHYPYSVILLYGLILKLLIPSRYNNWSSCHVIKSVTNLSFIKHTYVKYCWLFRYTGI